MSEADDENYMQCVDEDDATYCEDNVEGDIEGGIDTQDDAVDNQVDESDRHSSEHSCSEEDDEDGEEEDADVHANHACEQIEKEVYQIKKTRALMTKYEYAKILGERAEQIANGAPVLIETDEHNALIIAELELAKNLLNFVVKRPLGKNVSEHCVSSDLKLPV